MNMNGKQTGEQNLVTIRALIERGETYRAIFARAAFIGGLLSILTATGMYVNDEVTRFLDRPIGPREFAFAWLSVFVMTTVIAVGLLCRAARGNNDGSARMQFGLRSVAPFALIPVAFSGWFFATGYLGAAELDLVTVWVVSYGLILLSIAFFLPRSIASLGWAFLLTGLSVPVLADKIDNWVDNVPTVLMGLTFGIYHLIFAAVTCLRTRTKVTTAHNE